MMFGLSEKIRKVREFLTRDVWEFELGELSKVRAFLLRQAQIAVLVGRDFVADRCLLRASALTYTTLLAIVPLLALMFALLKGLGVQNTLEPIILDKIAIGSEQIVTEIVRYINNTNVGRLGTVGLVALILTVIALLSNVEESFNHVWGVQETRSHFRRFADYSSVLILGPVFLLAAISMTTTLESQAFVQKLLGMAVVGELILFLFKFLPFLAMWAAFTFLYIFMPNIRVNFPSALLGGIIGGTLWQFAQWGYLYFQVGVARYNAIYGTMAALPIFMVWIYVSWLIVLFGLEVTYAYQNLRVIRREIRGESVNFASRELVALAVLVEVVDAFQRGERPWQMVKIASNLELPPRLARSVLDELVRLQLLSEVHAGDDSEFAYQPARAPETIAVHEVLQALKEDGVGFTRQRRSPEWRVVAELEGQLDGVVRDTLGELSVRDMVMRVAERRRNEGEGGQ